MNEWKRLLAEIKNIKLNTNNTIKQYIHQRCYQVTNNIYGNPKSLIIKSRTLSIYKITCSLLLECFESYLIWTLRRKLFANQYVVHCYIHDKAVRPLHASDTCTRCEKNSCRSWLVWKVHFSSWGMSKILCCVTWPCSIYLAPKWPLRWKSHCSLCFFRLVSKLCEISKLH